MKFSTRLVLGAVGTVFITAATLVVVADRWLRAELEQAFAEELEREAKVIAAGISSHPADLSIAAHRYGALTGRRVTLMSPDGVVLGDSDFDEASLAHLENHLTRPEVQAALAGRTGVHRRLSASTNRVELKVAIAMWPGVVRVSAPIDQVDALVGRVTGTATVAGVVAVVFGALLAVIGGRAIARPVRQLAHTANEVAEGAVPGYPTTSVPELRELGRAMVRMHGDVQKRLEQLRREREETSTMIESMVEGVIAADAKGRVVLCNGAMRTLLGYGPDDAIPNVTELFFLAEAREAVERVMNGREVLGREIEIEGRQVLMTAHPLPKGGAVLGFLDVTDLRRLQLVRRDFVANVSHELKTPLTSILGYTETLLADNLDDATRRNFLDVIHNNAGRMQRLVDDLLDLARLESGAWSPEPVALDPVPLARETWAAIGERDSADAWTFAIDAGSDITVTADRGALQQILGNLFHNARRHTPTGGTITLTARPAGDSTVIEVSDTGTGIPTEHVGRIFERFYRVDPSRSREDGGTGLGLSIVKHLVEAHGGEITVRSQLGRGTRFTMRFPAMG